MGKEAKADYFEQAALLGIEPIKPGETFRLTREIRRWEAEQILAMHPRRSHRLGMLRIARENFRDFAEISAHSLFFASTTALAAGVILTLPVILAELGLSSFEGRPPKLMGIITYWGGFVASFAAAGGFFGALSEANYYPEERLFRFGQSH